MERGAEDATRAVTRRAAVRRAVASIAREKFTGTARRVGAKSEVDKEESRFHSAAEVGRRAAPQICPDFDRKQTHVTREQLADCPTAR